MDIYFLIYCCCWSVLWIFDLVIICRIVFCIAFQKKRKPNAAAVRDTKRQSTFVYNICIRTCNTKRCISRQKSTAEIWPIAKSMTHTRTATQTVGGMEIRETRSQPAQKKKQLKEINNEKREEIVEEVVQRKYKTDQEN